MLSEITLFWPEYKAPIYIFVSDPVSNPFGSQSDPDTAKSFVSFRIQIRNTGGWGAFLRILITM